MWEVQRSEGSGRGDNVHKMLAMNMRSTELSYEYTNVFISFHNT